MADWVVAGSVILGVLSGLVGQAIYWSVFKARIEMRAANIEADVSKLERSRSEIWTAINAHGERISKVEASCATRHGGIDV